MRIYLVQPDDAIAAELTADFEEAANIVTRVVAADTESVRELGDQRPDVVLVSLDGDHDRTLDLVEELGERRRLRGVPRVFCGGTQAALTRAQGDYPRASFSRRDVILNVLASLRS